MTAPASAPRLDRARLGRPAPPVRIVHLGLGAFARSHQAWFTDRVDPDGEWGIAGFTGRSATGAQALAEQGGAFTVITRSPDGDEAAAVASIATARRGDDQALLAAAVADPAVALVTLTISEAGYRVDPDAPPEASALGRLAVALDARRAAHGAPIALVPCDNVPANGSVLRDAIAALAGRHAPSLVGWLAESASFVSTSVDRITPRTTADDLATVERLCGWRDEAAVVAEPFADWVLSGGFPGGRPPWQRHGARFVDDIAPFERRKLWLLNGAHTLLAAAGPARGHRTVAEAIADPVLHRRVERLWDAAERHLDAELLDLPDYRSALLRRFGNGRIRHELDQIATDAATKLRARIVPVALAELADGRDAAACAAPIGAWIAELHRGHRAPDALDDEIDAALAGADGRLAVRMLRLLAPELADHDDFASAVVDGSENTADGAGAA